MRRLILILGALAIAGVMSRTAAAQFQYLWMNYFWFDNSANGGPPGAWCDGSGPAWQAGGWNATTSGALWISTGGTTPVLNTQDLNFELDYRPTPASPWTIVTNSYLLSTGVANRDTFGSYYAGYWVGSDGATGVGNDHPDPSPYRINVGEYYVPGETYNPDYPQGQPTQAGMQFNLYAWAGDSASFASAAASGAQVGVTGAFQVGPTNYEGGSLMPQTTTFINMPSLVLTIPGDANYDGRVDINDLTVVLAHYNQTGMTWADGEFTGSGTVDINDLTIVLAHYNQSVGSSAAATAAVPEPATMALAAAALAGVWAYGWRRTTSHFSP